MSDEQAIPGPAADTRPARRCAMIVTFALPPEGSGEEFAPTPVIGFVEPRLQVGVQGIRIHIDTDHDVASVAQCLDLVGRALAPLLVAPAVRQPIDEVAGEALIQGLAVPGDDDAIA